MSSITVAHSTDPALFLLLSKLWQLSKQELLSLLCYITTNSSTSTAPKQLLHSRNYKANNEEVPTGLVTKPVARKKPLIYIPTTNERFAKVLTDKFSALATFSSTPNAKCAAMIAVMYTSADRLIVDDTKGKQILKEVNALSLEMKVVVVAIRLSDLKTLNWDDARPSAKQLTEHKIAPFDNVPIYKVVVKGGARPGFNTNIAYSNNSVTTLEQFIKSV